MQKYYKNFILCGDMDYHCLLCQESFQLIPDVEKHIRWEKHRKNSKNQAYFSKFKNEGIYKIRDKYYCEICNYIASTFTDISNHVKTDNHKHFKFAKTSPAQNDRVAEKKIKHNMADMAPKNCFEDMKCLLCKVDVNNMDEHVKTQKHMANLSQPGIGYHKDGRYYKKIDQTYYCFTCKKVFEKEPLNEHWSTCNFNNDVEIESSIRTIPVNENPEDVIYRDIIDSGKRRSELSKYGKNNFIKLNHNGSKGFCSLCDRILPAHITNFKEHVNGLIHRGHLELKGMKKPTNRNVIERYQTVDMETFLKTDTYNMCTWMDPMSLCFLKPSKIDNKIIKCYACDEMLNRKEAGEHCTSSKHKATLIAAKFVVAGTEFIREIRPNLFHCGFCNLTCPYLETLDKHVRKSSLHLELKYKGFIQWKCNK